MIFLQVISMLVLIFVVVLMYVVALKLVNDHRELHSIKDNPKDQDNLDLTDKQ